MSISIDSRDALERSLANGSVIRSKWAVLCEIGPDWIGAGRRFEFWVDDVPLDRQCIGHQLLARAIVERFALPLAHEREATWGSAIIERHGDGLWIDYEWSRGVPYDHPAATDVGEGRFELPRE